MKRIRHKKQRYRSRSHSRVKRPLRRLKSQSKRLTVKKQQKKSRKKVGKKTRKGTRPRRRTKSRKVLRTRRRAARPAKRRQVRVPSPRRVRKTASRSRFAASHLKRLTLEGYPSYAVAQAKAKQLVAQGTLVRPRWVKGAWRLVFLRSRVARRERL